MIKTMIVDDERMARDTLRKMLELYCPSIEVAGECENVAQAKEMIPQLRPDLVFLDVAMPGKTGVELLKETEDIFFEVIFVTAHDKYLLQAIRLAAIDYLLKPIDEQQLTAAVSNAAKRIQQKSASHHLQVFLNNLQQPSQQQHKMQVCIPSLSGFRVVHLDDIVYCEADNTYTHIHFTDKTKMVASRSLMDYELLLQDTSFFRIHKSILVNMRHIKEYQKGEGGFVITSTGKALEVSRRKKESFITKMKGLFRY